MNQGQIKAAAREARLSEQDFQRHAEQAQAEERRRAGLQDAIASMKRGRERERERVDAGLGALADAWGIPRDRLLRDAVVRGVVEEASAMIGARHRR